MANSLVDTDTTHFSAAPAKGAVIQGLWLLVMLSWLPIMGATRLNPLAVADGTAMLRLPEPNADFWGPLADFVPWVSPFAALFVGGALVAWGFGQRALAYALCLGLALEFMPDISGVPLPEASTEALRYWLTAGGVAVAFAASVMLTAIYGRLLSPAFLGFIGLVVYESAVIGVVASANALESEVAWRAPAVLGRVFEGFAPNPAVLLVVLSAFVALRLFFKAVQDNADLLMQLRVDGRLGASLFHALRLWLPMLAIFAVLTVGYSAMWRGLDHVAAETALTYADVPAPAEPLSFEEMLVHIQTEQTMQWQAELNTRSLATQDQVNGLVRDSAEETHGFVEEKLPQRAPGTNTERCGWNLKCHFMNLVKSITNSIYQGVRQGILDGLEARLERAETEAGRGTEAFRQRAVTEVDAALAIYRDTTTASIGQSFLMLNAVSVLLLIYSLMVLFKTYLIVLGRVILHPDESLTASLAVGRVPRSQGMTRASERGSLAFGKARRDVLYVKRDTGVYNVPTSARVPMPFKAIFSRILHRAWRMQKVDLSQRSQVSGLTMPPPASLVEWTLRSDEQVVFEWTHFVGVSSTVRIKRLLSFNLASLIFGRAMVHYAQGPGVLILKTNASAILPRGAGGKTSTRAARSYGPGCFVARDVHAGFGVHSDLSEVMRGNYLVAKLSGDTVLIDTMPNDGGAARFGILRYARTFLLPF
ncbi:hypothetical protein [Primorskyibacter flagellatus]|uniref:Uncharacterized protein n=1 Tax=Primorskyibacter flagellatus TaxID=1387277 RepID=A0A1W2EQT4_9RHOB|nr:hypothetical protein [Primorskyibacter flagellatus]SMD12069.1 hypothetical protein SAMN06295998_1386 [Primorskyibacter flagellatus]